MDKLTQYLSSIKPYRDCDFIDRLNSFYTVIGTVCFAVLVSGWSFVGTPIQCWFPAYFKGWWIQYSLDYCYVQNTYFLPFTKSMPLKNYWDLIRNPIDIPESVEKREERLIGYYQWVPFILALVAVCFWMPMAFWRALNMHSVIIDNLDLYVSIFVKTMLQPIVNFNYTQRFILHDFKSISVKTVCDMTSIVEHVEPLSRQKNVDKIAQLLDHSTVLSARLHGRNLFTGRYILLLYLAVKIYYVINAVMLFFMLQHFLGVEDSFWGARVFYNLVYGRQWEETGNFPRVTICDFEVRELGNVHRHSVQCVLMINMFNEKIFLFFWWWFVILAVLNFVNLLCWIASIIFDSFNSSYVISYLEDSARLEMSENEFLLNIEDFVKTCLQPDGMFLLRLIGTNSGDIVSKELVNSLWNRYISRKKSNPKQLDDDQSLSEENQPILQNYGDNNNNNDGPFTDDSASSSREDFKESSLYTDHLHQRAANLHANLKSIIRLKFIHLPIQCWVPAQFTGAWEQYTENYCFVQNTYFLQLTNQIPVDYVERDSREIGYYQWVPFILALQAFLFYLPCLIWRLTNWYSGISVLGITNMAVDAGNMDHETRKKNVKTVAQHIRQSLYLQRELSTSGKLFGFLIYGKHYGIYVTGLYLLIKFLYILNVVCQFLILNRFLGAQYTFWGFEILRDLAYGREWQESGHFPRVTMCDFDVRVLGNLHRWTVQCVLMINMFNEKIYLFLWWWFFIISIFTFLNFFYWIFVSFNQNMQVNFISRYLRVSDKISDTLPEQRRVSKFVRRELRPDGVFLLRIIASNAGDIIATELIKDLWTVYDAKQNHPTPPPVQSKKNMNYDKNDQSPYKEEKMPLAGSH
ncbi:Innexin unc-9 [Trichinella zimbabwensis]|uniref:Innexin n=1 Tax=Trichinella zimbabwensis TaxID=268475 RepID=A0A0V1HR67_9BILA|nr:Innexin unc-9 [Trichinella zimbabwensis]